MDIELVYSLVGIVIFVIIIVVTLRSDVPSQIQSKEEKKYEIINGYKKQLREALEPLKNNDSLRVAKKKELLLKFTNELSLNIFFDQDENKEIISDLSQEF